MRRVAPQPRHDPSSLERNAHGRAASAIVVALLLYAIVDAVAGPWSYAEPPLSLAYIHVTAGALAALLAASWLQASTLRRMEKAGLALLIGVVSAGAMIPGALRINALTAPAAAAYPYYIEPGPSGIILRPAAQGMPAIDYFGDSAFWSSFSATRTYPVELRRGALGFYQFNSAAIVEDMRRHAGH